VPREAVYTTFVPEILPSIWVALLGVTFASIPGRLPPFMGVIIWVWASVWADSETSMPVTSSMNFNVNEFFCECVSITPPLGGYFVMKKF